MVTQSHHTVTDYFRLTAQPEVSLYLPTLPQEDWLKTEAIRSPVGSSFPLSSVSAEPTVKRSWKNILISLLKRSRTGSTNDVSRSLTFTNLSDPTNNHITDFTVEPGKTKKQGVYLFKFNIHVTLNRVMLYLVVDLGENRAWQISEISPRLQRPHTDEFVDSFHLTSHRSSEFLIVHVRSMASEEHLRSQDLHSCEKYINKSDLLQNIGIVHQGPQRKSPDTSPCLHCSPLASDHLRRNTKCKQGHRLECKSLRTLTSKWNRKTAWNEHGIVFCR